MELKLGSSWSATLAVEIPLFVSGIRLYARATTPDDNSSKKVLDAFLAAIY